MTSKEVCKNRYTLATPKFQKGVKIKLCTDVTQECNDYEKFTHGHDIKICDVKCVGYCLRRG